MYPLLRLWVYLGPSPKLSLSLVAWSAILLGFRASSSPPLLARGLKSRFSGLGPRSSG